MKLFELGDFENTTYKNDAEEQDHLFRRQASKCHSINLFILKLAKKFPDWWRVEGHDFWKNHPTKQWEAVQWKHFTHSSNKWRLPVSGSDITTREIKREFEAKYDAMRKAKSQFEDAGGKYPQME